MFRQNVFVIIYSSSLGAVGEDVFADWMMTRRELIAMGADAQESRLQEETQAEGAPKAARVVRTTVNGRYIPARSV
jgi:hypothetical protein